MEPPVDQLRVKCLVGADNLLVVSALHGSSRYIVSIMVVEEWGLILSPVRGDREAARNISLYMANGFIQVHYCSGGRVGEYPITELLI